MGIRYWFWHYESALQQYRWCYAVFYICFVILIYIPITVPKWILKKLWACLVGIYNHPERSLWLILYLACWGTVMGLYLYYSVSYEDKGNPPMPKPHPSVIVKEVGTFFLGGVYILYQIFGKVLGW